MSQNCNNRRLCGFYPRTKTKSWDMLVSAEKYYCPPCFQQNFIMTLLPHSECGIVVIISFHNSECGVRKYWTWYSHPDYISSSLDWTLFLYPRVRVRPLPILCLHKLHSRFSFDSAYTTFSTYASIRKKCFSDIFS